MRERVADFIINQVEAAGSKDIFFVPGTGCMYLIDALIRNKRVHGINMNHEQAAGMAALTYGQIKNTIGTCIVTTGCGGTNAITALLHAWQDSIPCVFISGQVDRNHTIHNSDIPVRQFGRQEADIIKIVSSISKYSVMLNDLSKVVYEIEKALHIVVSGRKGPVWIDVPMDIQNAIIEIDEMEHYIPNHIEYKLENRDKDYVIEALKKAERPVVLVGNGVRLSNAEEDLKRFIEKYKIPLVYSRLGHDLMDTDYPLSIGMIGMLGATRAGNFCIQNSDLVLCIGCRLSINTTGEEYEKFARAAKLIVVDIDKEEHQKQTVRIDYFISCDASVFLKSLITELPKKSYEKWVEKCSHWKKTMPVCLDKEEKKDKIGMYSFVEALSQALPPDGIVVCDAGDVYYTVTSGIRIKEGQRSITSGAQAEMGYALPGGIGASFAATERTICVVNGDGSFMMNLQELATVSFYQLPIKIFILNNNGYAGIRRLHKDRFRRYIGCDREGGLGLPDLKKVAYGFDIPYCCIEGEDRLTNKIEEVLKEKGPVLCEVMCTEQQKVLMVSSIINQQKHFIVRPLEDQAPFLPRDVFLSEMVIDAIDQ